MVHPKILSSLTHPHVILNPYDFLSSVEQKGRCLECLFPHNGNKWEVGLFSTENEKKEEEKKTPQK